MSSEPVIRLRGISKCFQRYPKPAYRLVQALYGQRRKLYEEFWALRNIDLDVLSGETIGVVGRNGSGKSTLLQIIVGTLTATAGTVECAGRVSAILELGAGFNPEFTGVENARLNAAIIGIPRQELADYLPRIIEFSELGDFIHRPVKTYSSGMYVRLAFSVAINMQPDILVIDEALAVGDLKFQRKCFRKLEQLKDQGVTILFVTHATDTVVAQCDRALFIDGGEIKEQGQPKTVVNAYLESLFQVSSPSPGTVDRAAETAADGGRPKLSSDPQLDACRMRLTYNNAEYRWGDQRARIIDYLILDETGAEVLHSCPGGQVLRVFVRVYFEAAFENLIYGLTIKTVHGTAVYGTNSRLKQVATAPCGPGEWTTVCFEIKMDLVGGDYFFSLGVVDAEPDTEHEAVLDRRYDLSHVKVEETSDAFGLAVLDARVQELDDPELPF